ncbi:MAG: hypothetical protein ABSA13_18920 [Beijerinckiaceae bacterium]|jgi:hypothetical protein
MIFPTATGTVPLSIQWCTFAQDSQNGSTTFLELWMRKNLTTAPTADIPDIAGTGDTTKAQPDAPDYSTGK